MSPNTGSPWSLAFPDLASLPVAAAMGSVGGWERVEPNHLVIVDLPTATVIRDFAAGEATVENVDATEEELGPQGKGLIAFEETLTKRREPDAVTWLGNSVVGSANEGDYEDESGEEGGSRGFTLFNAHTGAVIYESAEHFEHAAARAGHYNEGRSENKGGEPEAILAARYGGYNLLFVGAERATYLVNTTNSVDRDIRSPAQSTLIRNLAERRTIRPYVLNGQPSSGIDVSSSRSPRSRSGPRARASPPTSRSRVGTWC